MSSSWCGWLLNFRLPVFEPATVFPVDGTSESLETTMIPPPGLIGAGFFGLLRGECVLGIDSTFLDAGV
jgi:hypothetical protein